MSWTIKLLGGMDNMQFSLEVSWTTKYNLLGRNNPHNEEVEVENIQPEVPQALDVLNGP